MGAGEGRGLLRGDGSWAPASSGVCPKPPSKPRVEHRKRYRIAQPRKSPSEDCRATLQVRARLGPASPVASCLLPLSGGPAASPWATPAVVIPTHCGEAAQPPRTGPDWPNHAVLPPCTVQSGPTSSMAPKTINSR